MTNKEEASPFNNEKSNKCVKKNSSAEKEANKEKGPAAKVESSPAAVKVPIAVDMSKKKTSDGSAEMGKAKEVPIPRSFGKFSLSDKGRNKNGRILPRAESDACLCKGKHFINLKMENYF
jgi:hypothetical protein